MSDNNNPKAPNLQEIRAKIEKSGLPIDPTLIVNYKGIRLYVELSNYDFIGGVFYPSMTIVKEVVPDNIDIKITHKRAPKTPKPQGATKKK